VKSYRPCFVHRRPDHNGLCTIGRFPHAHLDPVINFSLDAPAFIALYTFKFHVACSYSALNRSVELGLCSIHRRRALEQDEQGHGC
jgi:hypothetical protein